MKPNPDPAFPSRPEPGAAPEAALRQAAAEWVVRRDAGFAAGEEQAWRDWLAADPRHCAAWARLDRAWGVLDGPRHAGMADWVLLEITGRIRRRRRRRLATLGGLAALLLAVFFWRMPRRPGLESPPAPTVVVSGPTERILPDGSVVELKDNAAIDVDFSGPLRRVALRRGEAFFKVAKNPHRPFVVEAGHWEVRAVGTEFSVAFGTGELGVLVREGRVAVNPSAPGRDGPALAAKPVALVDAGNRLTVRTASAPGGSPVLESVPEAEMRERLAWLSTRLEFSRTPLAEAVALMNRHNRLQFVIEDPALADVRVSGFIRADNAEAFARFLETGFEVKAEMRGGDVVVLRRSP
jgi:transmembrane sensor